MDFYKFTLSSSGRINISLTAYILRTNYYLYDANGKEIWSKLGQYCNSTTGRYDLETSLTLSTGTYYLSLERREGTGNYNFCLGAPRNPFLDVLVGKYYYDAVLWAVENGITKGADATHFAPNKTCTRGQVVTFLYNALG